jgi:tetratricopeptide (TPR) repeat protein
VRTPGGAHGRPLHQLHHDHQDWRSRSYFFGSASPFDTSGDNSTAGSSYAYGFGYGFGLGYGLGYVGGGYGGGSNDKFYLPNYASSARGIPRARLVSAAQFDDEVPADQVQNALDFAGQGEVDFKQGKYPSAVQSWRHALVDDPRNGAIVLLLGQALFAVGQYDEAAGATQAALSMLPEDKWGTVVTHYKELYPNAADYTTQIRALEKARDAKPEAPAFHFLLGYHFGYLNYPKHAVRELDKVLAVMPKDKIAQKLRDEFAAKLTDADKAALEKQANKPADGGKPNGDAKTPDTPAESSDKPADDKDSDKKETDEKSDQGKTDDDSKTDGKDGA